MSRPHKWPGYPLLTRGETAPMPAVWAAYDQQRAQTTANPLLEKTLACFAADPAPPQPRVALDLGCGAGQATRALLAQGWQVWALDVRPEIVRYVQQDLPAAWAARLTVQLASFEAVAYGQVALPPADLIWASHSLPYCSPQAFAALWRTGCAALRLGGRWAGHLFGNRDSWAATQRQMTFHTLAQVQHLLRDWALEFWAEDIAPGQTATGAPRLGHVFTFIARQL